MDATGGSSRGRLRAEVLLVVALAFGLSIVSSIISIINRATLDVPLSQQTQTLITSVDARPVFDVLYQLTGNLFAVAPAALALFFLWRPARPRFGAIGLDGTRPARDLLWGLGLAAAIGIPGIGLYLAGRALGLTVNVVATTVDIEWWTVLVLLVNAARAAVIEEVVVLGYLLERLRRLGWGNAPAIALSAVVRGSYHLYQGFGPFIANTVMGVLFGWIHVRTGRLWPFLVAHFVIDAVVFVGYPAAVAWWPDVFA